MLFDVAHLTNGLFKGQYLFFLSAKPVLQSFHLLFEYFLDPLFALFGFALILQHLPLLDSFLFSLCLLTSQILGDLLHLCQLCVFALLKLYLFS
jgi:hypothetical protein